MAVSARPACGHQTVSGHRLTQHLFPGWACVYVQSLTPMRTGRWRRYCLGPALSGSAMLLRNLKVRIGVLVVVRADIFV
jgi:hypothetical protein